MPGQRLLIVDNDRAFLKEHQVSLESAFEVEVIASPDTAMQRLETGAFAFALICVEIADNRGYALCASVRRSAKLSEVKVGLISSKATEDEYKRHQGLKGRADLYLMKPIQPVALVEALRPFVPPRGVDPDNPLGDLADDGDLSGDLGGDWLGDLKTDLDEHLTAPPPPPPAARPASAGTVAISPAEIQAAMAKAAQPPDPSRATAPPGTVKPDMAEARAAHLEEELQAKSRKLKETEDALVQLQRQLNSVTVNLDELERSKREAGALEAKLAEAQAALAKAEESGDVASLRQQLKDAITERSSLIQQADQLNQQLSEKTTRTIDLLRERDKLQTQALEIPSLQARADTAEAESAKHRERADQHKDEITNLEATVRGQSRQLAQIQDTLADMEAKLKVSEEKAAAASAAVKEADATKASLAKDIEKALRESQDLRKELEESKARHDRERMELMGGLDVKEAELARHKDQLKAAQDANAAHEKDKQGLQGQLADRGDRLKALAALMEELTEKLRHGGGLAKE